MTPRRVLVAGSYPPVPLPEARATAAAVAALAAQGTDVEVLAPRPSAAHHTASFHSWRGALALARLARSFDVVVLRVEAGFPLASQSSRWRRTSGLMGLGLALRSAKTSVVHVEDLAVVPPAFRGAAARVLWKAAGSVTVRSAADRDALAGFAGIDPHRVVVDPLPGGSPVGAGRRGSVPGHGREAVMQLVADRARVERARVAVATGTGSDVDPLGPAVSVSRAMARSALEKVLGPRTASVVARTRRLLHRR